MNLKEAFKIRKKDAESDEVIISIGNHLATEQVFKSEEETHIVTGKKKQNKISKKRGGINHDSSKNFR